jgi:glutamate carboxypeptidase
MLSDADFPAEEILGDVLPWVGIESPTTHVDGVNRMTDAITGALSAIGGRIERRQGRDGYGDIALARFSGADPTSNAGILILSHSDTIHPVGTLNGRLPLRRDGDRYYGPGIYDMKAGTRMAVHALGVLRRLDRMPRLPVTYMIIPDEEVGSPSSREAIEAEARKNRYVLVTEPCKSGVIVTGRYAFQRFWITAHGRPAHAGANNRDGRSAIRAMAGLIQCIEAMTDFQRGMTFSVGTISGGTFVNVMPIECRAQVLTVAPTQEIHDEIGERMLGLAGESDGVRIEVERGPVRPLWTAHEETMKLYATAARLAGEIGIDLRHGSFGGGSDGNFTGAMGVATLDGLGADGAGAHTFDEHILVSSLGPRSRLFAMLLEALR